MTESAELSDAQRMMRLFAGYMGAHGTHGLTSRSEAKGGKLEIKKTAKTVREPVTEQLWQEHLDGDRPIGIIPISEDNTCHWGCIDVDRYDLDLGDELARIEKLGLPLVICRSKSGGAHVFLFLSSPVPAEELRAHLRQVAASLGWGDCEIFPKQNQIFGERGDLGNWLNMPYLDAPRTQRYGIKRGGMGMTLQEFLRHAEGLRTGLGSVRPVSEEREDESLDDGPPCLQHLVAVGFPEGSRNNGLFSLGVFCKKKYGARWREMLEKYNRESMQPPLPADEVMAVISSLEKKDYGYKCKDAPCVSYCNSMLCKMRKYGIGGGGLYPEIGGLSKLETEPPIWFLDIEDQRVELSTRQLLNYREFQAAAAEKVTVLYQNLKSDTWVDMIGEAMTNAVIIEAPVEASTSGHFRELLVEFCTDSHAGTRIEDLWLGKPFLDEEEGRYLFRLQDLMLHLERRKFTVWGRNKVAQHLRDVGGHEFMNVKGRGLNVFWVDADDMSPPPDVDMPPSRSSPI